MNFPVVKVGDLSEQIRGVTYAKGDASNIPEVSFVPLLRAGNIASSGIVLDDLVYVPKEKVHPRQMVKKHDVLVAASSGSVDVVGKSAQAAADFNGTFGAFCKVLRVKPGIDIDPSYFGHYFRTLMYRKRVMRLAAGANINNLKNEHLDDMPIPFPALDVQRIISQVLDLVDTLRAKRREAISLLDELAQSIFFEMFGKVVPNDRGWQYGKVSDLVAQFSSGKSIADTESEGPRARYRILRVSAVTSGYFESTESKPAPVGYEPPTSHVVRDRDLLFSRANTKELIGATAIAVNPPPNLLLPDKLWRFEWRNDRPTHPLFVRQLFRQAEFKREIETRSSGTSGSMKNISQANVLSIPLGIPPKDLQIEYGQRVAAVDQLRVAHQTHLAELDALFASLQDRAFRGELWTEESAPVP